LRQHNHDNKNCKVAEVNSIVTCYMRQPIQHKKTPEPSINLETVNMAVIA